ncbi:hypothetical protein L1987_79945 [Smallanthus sonchifolius]|uniref:Uncharacterized protein n=1 Tax=Smallanthus sonchifolius TaxID=185202 RepID=A0ACB8YLD1_9ASTR|nr:hypothetical protein L1987_79945 [Smallanthus sonchifolius]
MPLTHLFTLKSLKSFNFHHLHPLKLNTYIFPPQLIKDMIIKRETTTATRLHHPSPAKGSSLSYKKYQNLLIDSAPSGKERMITRTRRMAANRRHRASKEMVRRALTPPARRLTWRWFDFRPTPSRLSVMSMAI